ncbi:MAG: hypothetical protein IVW57_11735 [Ktedonobacterales bacterium]|nr:hypothetical protein [Ktedonobacterales bacterium]
MSSRYSRMHARWKKPVSILLPVVGLVLIGTLAISSAFARSQNAPSGTVLGARSSALHTSATRGTLTPASRVAPTKDAPTKGAPTKGAPRPRGVRPLHRRTKASVAASQIGRLPLTGDATLSSGTAGTLDRNFNGVSSLDSANTNFGLEFEPPDQGLCTGNGFVVEAVNSAYTIYRTNGTVVSGPFNVNALFGEGLTEFTSDPRCYFDKATNTWFAIILFINSAGTESRTDLAVNPSGDPTTPWTVYHIEANDDGTGGMPSHPGCPCLGDQPLLGIDAENVYLSTNEFSILGSEFNGAQIYAISKSQLVALASTVNFAHFDNLSIGGAVAASVQPAITYGGAAAEYFLNSLDPDGTFDNRLGVWALTNRHAVTLGGTPTLSSLVLASEVYGVPPGAVQKGASSLLDSGDDRMQQVQFMNGRVWGALDTAVNVRNDTTARAGIAWFKVEPFLSGSVLGGAALQQGYVASRGNYLLYPAIQADRAGTAILALTVSSARYFPSAAYTLLTLDRSTFGPVHLAARGTGPYDANATRWGDYSAAVLDPDHSAFWLATEYIPPHASQTTDGANNWGTRVLEVDARE